MMAVIPEKVQRRIYKRRKAFFRKDSLTVAQALLGDYLVRRINSRILIGRIVETESYPGIKDDASHSFGGKVTTRNKVLYREGGLFYVYLIYGLYHCCNIVVSGKGDPQAVFIRALEPCFGTAYMKRKRGLRQERLLTNGPCRWTQAFGIDVSFSGKSVASHDIGIYRARRKCFLIKRAKRVGIGYASRGKCRLLRFYIAHNPFVSCP